MTPRLKAGLLGLLAHHDPAIAARAREDLAARDDPAVSALLKNSRDRSTGILNGPRRADRVAKSASIPGSNATCLGAGKSKADRPGDPYSFAHLLRAVGHRAVERAAAAEPASVVAPDAAARRMLAAACIAVPPTGSMATPWQPAQPKTYPSADAAARANLAADGVFIPQTGATNR